jgi:hypothetical protein
VGFSSKSPVSHLGFRVSGLKSLSRVEVCGFGATVFKCSRMPKGMEDAAVPQKLDPPIQLWIEQLRKNATVWLTASFVVLLIGSASSIGGSFIATVWAHDVLGWKASDPGYSFKHFLLALLPISTGGAIYNWISLNFHRLAQRCLRGEEFAAEQVLQKPSQPLDLLALSALYYVPMSLIAIFSEQIGSFFNLSYLVWILVGPLFAFTLPLIAMKQVGWREAVVGSIAVVRRKPAAVYATVLGLAGLELLGVFACGVGILVTMPAYVLGVNRLLLAEVAAA